MSQSFLNRRTMGGRSQRQSENVSKSQNDLVRVRGSPRKEDNRNTSTLVPKIEVR